MAETKRVKLKINDREVEVPAGTLLIEAAKKVGSYVPYYCYHPALGNPAVCRLCMVEVEGGPKPLQPSCRVPAAEGMVVRTNSPAAVRAQASSLEFHLVNHPLDCPVCDQAGECWLQDYYMQTGLYQSQVKEDKLHKDKRVPIGRHVMLDQERCILCTRCTRFLDDVTQTHELGIFNRGDRNVLAPYPGKTVDNDYSGNIVDICPVGALTDRDFRFKTRVWYLNTTPSVCQGCSRGCSIEIHTASRLWHTGGKRVGRYKPRVNPEVNGHWICDEGRYSCGYHDEHRLGHFRRRTPAGTYEKLPRAVALQGLGRELRKLVEERGAKGLAVLLSGRLSNEDFHLAKKVFVHEIGAGRVLVGPEPDQVGPGDDFLLRSERVPNLRGGRALGFGKAEASWDDIRRGIETGEVWGLYAVERDPSQVWGEAAPDLLGKLAFSAYQASNSSGFSKTARWSLASATHGEEDGTFTNFEGRVQRYRRAMAPLREAWSDWRIFNELLAAWDAREPFDDACQVFADLAAKEPEFRGLTWEGLGANGQPLAGAETTPAPMTAGARRA